MLVDQRGSLKEWAAHMQQFRRNSLGAALPGRGRKTAASFIQQIFTGHLLCASSRQSWESSGEQLGWNVYTKRET